MIVEEVRKRIRECGRTQYAICKATGIEVSAMHRFMKSEQGITIDTLEKLMPILGLALVSIEPMLPAKVPPGRPRNK
jgi:transcriptional regulator with XRE-family HTH domain